MGFQLQNLFQGFVPYILTTPIGGMAVDTYYNNKVQHFVESSKLNKYVVQYAENFIEKNKDKYSTKFNLFEDLDRQVRDESDWDLVGYDFVVGPFHSAKLGKLFFEVKFKDDMIKSIKLPLFDKNRNLR